MKPIGLVSRDDYVVAHMVRRDSFVIEYDRVEIAFILALFLTKEGRKPVYPDKTSSDELQKKIMF